MNMQEGKVYWFRFGKGSPISVGRAKSATCIHDLRTGNDIFPYNTEQFFKFTDNNHEAHCLYPEPKPTLRRIK